jgi:hypothetical protein
MDGSDQEDFAKWSMDFCLSWDDINYYVINNALNNFKSGRRDDEERKGRRE